MVHSRLPVRSLLCLFVALLMLSPELLMGTPQDLYDVSATEPWVQKVLGDTVEEYNQYIAVSSTTYYKVLRVSAKVKLMEPMEYHFMLDLVKTGCEKTAGSTMKYESIQRCQQLPGNPEILSCHFVAVEGFLFQKCT